MGSVEVQIAKILEEYNSEVERAAREAAKEAAELTVRQLKASSPKKAKRGGRYARGWTMKKESDGVLNGYVVYNGTSPGLTHVLENGHVSRNQFGSYGRVRAIRHIGPAADAGIQRFELGIRARLRKG